MTENSKNTWSLILTIVKYAITAIIAFIGGNASASITF